MASINSCKSPCSCFPEGRFFTLLQKLFLLEGTQSIGIFLKSKVIWEIGVNFFLFFFFLSH